jgi:hypothetical protein
MLKSQVPVFVCSIAFIVATPQAANSGRVALMPAKKVIAYAGRAHAATPAITLKIRRISLPAPDQQQMKFVHAYIKNNDDCLLTVKHRSEGPFAIIDSVLTHYNLPLELKYLAVIESELKPTALSRVGAKGPWQLMPGTAHELGLKVNRRSDERVNYYKSTRAAARYLKDLHREFKDWLLVLAAYNGGPVPVYRAIRKSHSRNFWVLQKYLPAESRQHVKKFIATAYYFEGADSAAAVPPPAPAPMINYAVSKTQPMATEESPNERFSRLMKESAKSLRSSNEALSPTAN